MAKVAELPHNEDKELGQLPSVMCVAPIFCVGGCVYSVQHQHKLPSCTFLASNAPVPGQPSVTGARE